LQTLISFFQFHLRLLKNLEVQSVINGHRNLVDNQRQEPAVFLGISIGMLAAHR
jgi:hypothetical protein